MNPGNSMNSVAVSLILDTIDKDAFKMKTCLRPMKGDNSSEMRYLNGTFLQISPIFKVVYNTFVFCGHCIEYTEIHTNVELYIFIINYIELSRYHTEHRLKS